MTKRLKWIKSDPNEKQQTQVSQLTLMRQAILDMDDRISKIEKHLSGE